MPRYDYTIHPPTRDYVEMRIGKFENDPNYFGVESALRLVFDQWPTNTEPDPVIAKASLLDRLYSTNVYAIVPMAEHIVSLDIDRRLDMGDPDVVEKIATLSLSNSVRRHFSFATKYCSFSRPELYHIYDGNVRWLLLQYRNRFKFASFPTEHLDHYRTFADVLTQFVRYYALEGINNKALDKFLWIETNEIWNAAKVLNPSASPQAQTSSFTNTPT